MQQLRGHLGSMESCLQLMEGPHSSYMWLRDALLQYLPNARILMYGYDSKLARSHSFHNLSDVASRFRASLRIFIAHSLGGLVLKQAIVQISSGDAADSRNFKATYAILFFGVPNQGMDISFLLAMVPKLHFFLHPFSGLTIIHEVIFIFMGFVMIFTSPVWKEYGGSDRSEKVKVLVPAIPA